ncbi:MAG: glycosyltransferase family 9 protein [Candidatus Woesearchaeota archaeon]
MNTFLLKKIDKWVFGFVCLILYPFFFVMKSLRINRKYQDKTKIKNILIIKIWAIGDSVNTLPMIKILKEYNKKAKITVLASKTNSPVYEGQKFIDKIILLNTKNIIRLILNIKRYDLCLDLEPFTNSTALISFFVAKIRVGFSGQLRSIIYNTTTPFSKNQHIVKTYLDMVKIINDSTASKKIQNITELIKLKYSEKEKKRVDTLLLKNKIINKHTLIGFCPGVGDSIKERQWPKENFKKLAQLITNNNKKAKIILIGTKKEYELNNYIKNNNKNIINLSGKTDIKQLFYLIKKTRIFISNDTGPMHIAAAQGVNTIGLFGPNTPIIWAPFGKKNISIFHPIKGCPYMDNTKHKLVPSKLTEEQRKCMNTITIDEVFKAYENFTV